MQANTTLKPPVITKDRIDRLKAAIEGECDGLAISDAHAKAVLEYVDASLLDWAVSRWIHEVQDRPLINKNRRTLDDTWRQVVRFAGGDPDVLLGPSHDARLSAAQAGEGGCVRCAHQSLSSWLLRP